MLRQDRGEPFYPDIPAERGLDGKQIRDRCHHRWARSTGPGLRRAVVIVEHHG
jgi:hypothetical protein